LTFIFYLWYLTLTYKYTDSLPGSQSHETMLAIFQAEAATADEHSEVSSIQVGF